MDDLKVEAFGEKGVLFTRSFRAPKEMVFKAWTTPALVQKWLLGPGDHWSMPVCEIDLRVGGKYRYVWRNRIDGSEMGMGGEYLEIVPGEKIVVTEQFDVAWYSGTAIITLTLREEGGVTFVTEVAEYNSAETRDSVLRSPMESGVREGFNRLAQMVENA